MAAVPRRVVIKKERVTGTVSEWRGNMGFITPTVPINHIEAAKRGGKLFVAAADILGPKFLNKGAKVEFLVYSDGKGLGAQAVKLFRGNAPAQAPLAAKTPQAGKFGQQAAKPVAQTGIMQPRAKSASKPGGNSTVASSQVKGVQQTIKKPQPQLGKFAKAAVQNNAVAAAAASKKIRKYVRHGTVTGVVLRWCGKFGWIKPDKPLGHPAESKHKGNLYGAVSDLEGGLKQLTQGQAVQFSVYVDESGLGADKISPVGGASKAQQPQKPGQPAGKPGQPAQKPGQPAQKPGQPSWTPRNQAGKAGQKPQGPKIGKGAGKAQGKMGNKAGAVAGKGNQPAQKANTLVKKTIEKGGKGGKSAGGKSGKGGSSTPQAPKVAPPATTKLPANWEEHWSDEHSVPFFWNKITKESRWVKPMK